jgi:putative effector of murein hydrolase
VIAINLNVEINMSADFVSLLFLAGTVAIYACSKKLYLRYRKFWLSPILISPILLFVTIELTQTPFLIYFQDTRWLTWLLGPATIAFAYPIYTQRMLLRRYPITLMIGVLVGFGLGILSSMLLARIFHLPPDLVRSSLPRSVSTPFALLASKSFGGDQNLTVICVMITGVFGIFISDTFLNWLGLRSGISKGAALGASAHGFGTSKAYEIGGEEGAVASIVMVFTGITMVLLAPVVAYWVN